MPEEINLANSLLKNFLKPNSIFINLINSEILNNQNINADINVNLKKIKNFKKLTKKNEIKCFLSNENDILDCYIEFHAGAGGTESQDWAEMLRRMYLKWSDAKEFKFSINWKRIKNIQQKFFSNRRKIQL